MIANLCESVVKEKEKAYIKGKQKYIKGEQRDVSDIFDDIIRNNPDYLNEYPQLEMEYNIKDGSKKDLHEIIQYGLDLDDQAQKTLVADVIKNGDLFDVNNFLDDINTILSKYSEDEANNKMLDKILFENVGRILVDIEVQVDSQSMDSLKLNSYLEMLKKIQDKLIGNDFGASIMQEIDEFNCKLECTTQELLERLINKIECIFLENEKDNEFRSIQFLSQANVGISLYELYDMQDQIIRYNKSQKRIR